MSPSRSLRSEDELNTVAGSPVRSQPSIDDILPTSDQDFTPWHPGTEKFYQMVKRDISRQTGKNGPAYTLDEVVIEDPVPNITILRNYVQQLFSPKRPLQPKRVRRRTVPSKHSKIRELNLVLRVLQGYNFPARIAEPETLASRFGRNLTSQWRECSSAHISVVGSDGQEEVKEDDAPVETKPFIEIRFQGTTYR